MSESRMVALLRHKGGCVGLLLVGAVLVMALFPQLIAPDDPNQQALTMRNLPPVWLHGGVGSHLLGTDQFGRDLLSRTIYGARVSMIVGLATVVIQTTIGVTIGLVAGYFGGVWDAILTRLADVWLAIPFLVLAIAMAVILGPGLLNTVLVLGFVGWVTYARVVRGETLAVKSKDYVLAARGIGTRPWRLITRNILPNITASIVVVATLQVSRMIIAEASLSFLGLGVQPPQAAWGSMISGGRDLLAQQWWLSTIPGIALLLTALGINLLGDALRDVLEPRFASSRS